MTTTRPAVDRPTPARRRTHFFRALLGGRLLPEPLLREMTTPTRGSGTSAAMDAVAGALFCRAKPPRSANNEKEE